MQGQVVRSTLEAPAGAPPIRACTHKLCFFGNRWLMSALPPKAAPLINTTPHGATRMAVHATVDTTRSHAGAPVRDGLRLINA
jgi:hypothetical protein